MADTPHTRGAGVPEPAPEPAADPVPRLLCDARELAADDPARAGALWRLAEAGRQLDANLVRLPPEGRVEEHVEPDLDVLLYVVSGDGVVDTAQERRPLTEGGVLWLPRGSRRSLTAGRGGLAYLTVHRRRPGLQIKSRRDS
ncbi:cupin domain-containing protein [Streptomyces noursei]|uniref:cupin domain-containing protein n=1 Tax=Streptomyces noursei TaxID=1971 RepID=UPI0023B846ED|nr:cupin domain-containing protein [Streptomyces noursei]